ncbi:MAG: hypothetical protein ACE5IQ_13415 [Candidatus Methylomirabilales bacterium]
MSPDRKKLIVLVCLVIFWLGLILVRRPREQGLQPSQEAFVLQGPSAQRPGAATSRRRQLKKRVEMPQLKLSRIERVRPPFDPEVRNIFASIDRSSLRPPLPPGPHATAPTLPHPDPFLAEAKKLRFIGYAKAEGTVMAFVGYGSEVLVVPERQVFGGQFRIKEVQENTILVTSLDGTKEVVLGLNARLSTGRSSSEEQRGKQP